MPSVCSLRAECCVSCLHYYSKPRNTRTTYACMYQVLEDYGHPNHVLLVVHGFSLGRENGHDCVRIDAQRPSRREDTGGGGGYWEKLARMEAVRTHMYTYIYIYICTCRQDRQTQKKEGGPTHERRASRRCTVLDLASRSITSIRRRRKSLPRYLFIY